MPIGNLGRAVLSVVCLSLVASIFIVALPIAAQQKPPTNVRAEIDRVSAELSEKPTDKLPTEALAERVLTLKRAKRDALRLRLEYFTFQNEVGARNATWNDIIRARSEWIDAPQR